MVTELSIIIPTYNEEKYLPKLLTSIIKQNYKGKLQIIVVDGESEDKTIEVAKRFKDRIEDLEIIKAKRDVGSQRNVGVKNARYFHILFLDADMILPKDFLNRLLKKVNPKERILVHTSFVPSDANLFEWLVFGLAIPFIYLIYLYRPTSPGGFTLTTKENHKRVRGYKEDTILGEDTDYGHRSVADGAKPRLFFTPYVYFSCRRYKQSGMLRLYLMYLRGFRHVQKQGVIYKDNPGDFKYPYGHYKD